MSGGCANQGNGNAFRYANFPILGGANVPAGYPAITNDGWACATGSNSTAVEALAVCCTGAGEGTTTIRENSGTKIAQVECQS